jgi:N-acylneuraminate cytidylyltransferase
LVTARGGSKGLPRKNVLPVGGRPLIGWTIAAATGADFVSRVVVSTDDDEIMEASRNCGADVPFRRPPALASDTATSIDVVMHALDELPGFDYVVLLQPTSPLRTAEDIDAALLLAESSSAPACVSVCEATQSPYWMYRIDGEHRLAPLMESPVLASRRQDLPPVYVLNGAVYVARVGWLRETRSFLGAGCIAYPMPVERSLDIDTRADFEQFSQVVGGCKQQF